MRVILFIIQKELLQVFRNKGMLPVIFVMPIVQLIILVHAATLEVKMTKMIIVDNDLSSTSRKISNHFLHSPFFQITQYDLSGKEALKKMMLNEGDIIIEFPIDFEKDLKRKGSANMQVLINSINGTTAGLVNAYVFSIIRNFNETYTLSLAHNAQITNLPQIDVNYSYWYNQTLNYKAFMVPGILVLLITVIGLMLTAMNIVKEKEVGTIEQINVTPIKKYQFLIGKIFPFWVIALAELSFGLTVGKLAFDIPMVGSIGLLYLVAAVYLVVVLGFGIFISTIADTQQQAMFISFFFMMIFIMMSGLFTAIENMPGWAQTINLLNPVAYIIKAFRMILLKGSTLTDVKGIIVSLLFYAFIVINLAAWRYKKTS